MSRIVVFICELIMGIFNGKEHHIVCPLVCTKDWNNNKEGIQMKEVWEQRRQVKIEAIVTVQDMIEGNLEEINEAVCEFLDECIDGEGLLRDLIRLRTMRDHLFAVKNALEADVALFDELLATAVSENEK